MVTQGSLTVNDGNFLLNRTDNAITIVTVASEGQPVLFRLWDNDNNKRFTMKLPPDGSQFQFVRGNDTASSRMMVFTDLDRVGILGNAPVKDVDIFGELKVRGTLFGHGGMTIEPQGDLTIESQGDICIGNCP